MKGTYQIQIKGTLVDIEVTEFFPAVKCNYEHPEFQFEDEPIEFEWEARTDNDLLNRIIEEDLFEYINLELKKQLENLEDDK